MLTRLGLSMHLCFSSTSCSHWATASASRTEERVDQFNPPGPQSADGESHENHASQSEEMRIPKQTLMGSSYYEKNQEPCLIEKNSH